jgi:ABC-type lipoprotein release transport system permease subunit
VERTEKIEVLTSLYALAFFAGSMWDLLLPGRGLPVLLEALRKVLPAQDLLLYFILLPIVSGLFFGLSGIATCLCLGYENREIFIFIADLLREDLLEATVVQPLGVEAFLRYALWLLLAASGSALGACLSYLHEDPRWETLLSTLVYTSATALLALRGWYP